MHKKRDAWKSKFGIIMAVAGSAVGLGNFLRFPVQAAQNGGGAFMIPYFISLILLGIPLMWIEWTVGRFGGGFGHGTAPGIFHTMWEKNRFIKYFGVIGIFGPLAIFIYYNYIASWTLAYAVFSAVGKYGPISDQESMLSLLRGFQGIEKNEYFSSMQYAYLFFLITFAINIFIVYKGISGGIEKLCKIAMPTLFIFGIIIAIRVLTLGAPDPSRPSWNIINGLGFLWNPDFGSLKNAKVWLAAAGQIFFTLSVGIGVILTYASYLKKTDDIVLSGLTAASANEFAEVIIGSSIVIPAAFAFFGPHSIQDIAAGGAFNLGFVTMPLIFHKIAFSAFFGCLWFGLLFLAAITSSVSLVQPSITFLEDEFNISKRKAVVIFAAISFILCQPAIFLLRHGAVEELDFWGGTFCLVLFATVETILFGWVFGIEKAWEEIHHGADLEIPMFYKFIIKYITPLFLFFILIFWFIQQGMPVVLMKEISQVDRPYVLGIRLMLLSILLILSIMVKVAWKKRSINRAKK